jgi:hypothetical protein
MKLYKLTVEYAIVVAAEDDSSTQAVEHNATHYMMQGAENIISHFPDNVLAEEIKCVDDLPSGWTGSELPFLPPGHYTGDAHTIAMMLGLTHKK